MGVFAKTDKNSVLEDWEIAQFAGQMPHIFPEFGRFPESLKNLNENSITDIKSAQKNALASFKVDLKSPDRIRAVNTEDGTITRWPQLRLFTALGNVDTVQALLAAGANVNKLDGKGATALLVALNRALTMGDRGVLDILLQRTHGHTALNTPTPRQRLTPLYRAIELGQPDVVDKLLQQGADPNTRFLPDKQAPLYYTISLLWRLYQPQRAQQQLLVRIQQNPDMTLMDITRRQGVMHAGAFGDRDTLRRLNPDLLKRVVELVWDSEMQQHSKSRLTNIVRLLLDFGANPNAQHDYPVPGRTPLMLAAESDLLEVFSLMVEGYGGNPSLADADGKSSRDIARGFNARQIEMWFHRNR